MKLIKITPEYYEDVRKLRNDHRCQVGFIEQVNITKKQQIKYMEKYKNCYYICLYKGKFAGFVGSVNDDIRVCVKPSLQGKGIGVYMVNKIKKLYPTAYAKIKIDNQKSLRLFLRAGFKIKFFLLEQK